MRIGIFGDSFADDVMHRDYANYPSWVELLRTRYNMNVTNFAAAGSSLYYSFNLLKLNYFKFDKIIFVVTASGRITIPEYIPIIDARTKHINSLFTAEHILANDWPPITPENKKAVEAARDYFLYLYDHDREQLFHDLMIERLQKMFTDKIIIIDALPKDIATGMISISNKEISGNGLDPMDFRHNDARMCHMTKRNNEIFAEKVVAWLNGQPVEINLDDYVIPDKEELIQYKRL